MVLNTTAKGLPEDPADIVDRDHRLQAVNVVIGPHSTVSFAGIGVPPDELNTNSKPLYLYGIAKYSDLFAGTPRHVTKFCFSISGPSQVNPRPSTGLCRHWNCTDDECPGDKAEYMKDPTAP